ncbi:ABC transporter substrate-binding protein [Ureibacillus sp. FSL W8-0352]|uniref:ABC transporter substrate-binding protein n=1 Tax=Ureibacillus sp. FSL W8-0352 TaxID=2954596 RepID=UPI0030F5BAB1
MVNVFKKGLLTFIVVVLLLTLYACNNSADGESNKNDEKPTIKIGYIPITHAVPLFIEKELEEYEKFNLELIKFGSWTELSDALNTGRIDGASMLITLAMKAKEQGIDLKAIALGHRDGNVLVTSPEIDSVKDLKGENFAIPHKFSTQNVLLYQMLKQNGLEYEDVIPIELPPAEMPAALSEGRIAGYVVAEPFGAVAVSMDKGKVLYKDKELWKNSIDCALILRSDFIENDREIAEEFVNYYVQAGYFAEQKDEHVQEMLLNYMNVDENVLNLSLEWIAYDQLKINKEDYEELANNLKEMELLENPPSYEDFVDNSFIEKVK